ncbi:HAMP domain-containing histidine kinase [Virgibacillus halodenitrificans]|uniref:HAMP domain-containing sensor histidine kinase n=1 Tax=Virgibacillus halodenitrificans TaxID=1482 RepID=UPI001F3441BB|nr:HAMP domain-containing histidine kinase [Virgibacillus halodenitrificans]MCG1027308.1 HAMP domain-containing histidine kinase [Virgibacillus halodenitrificans]
MKLRIKIQLFSSIFMLLLILLVNTSIYFLFNTISAEKELNQLVEHTNTIAEALNNSNGEVTDEFYRAFLPAHGMIRLVKRDDKVIGEHTKDEKYANFEPIYTIKEKHQIVSQKNGVKTAIVSKPIIWKNGDIVTLQVSNRLVSLHETMQVLFFVLAIASLIILIPTIFAGNVLGRFLLNPIKDLIETMKENMREEEWKKIDTENRSKDELYEMEQTFNDMIDHLKENFDKQEVFVSDASHELKTPISIVKSYAQLLERRGKDNPDLWKESIEAIDSEVDRMQRLVEQMLLLAKNKSEVNYEQVELAALTSSVIQTFQGAYDRDIQFSQDGEALTVYGNVDQLKQVIYILIDNAIKYSDSTIHVKVCEKDENILLQVEDFGQGISEKDQKRVFDRFYRIDKARSRETGGTGLGLPIAKAIITAHRGNLTVESILGRRTVFTIQLPIS